ncbi:SusC/RagA family TonB-linked outer membrane protein [Chitinophaga sp. NPDC101104]|uniref:SusC/RagA family TonB-linked outer membrane protein n=1 Tax=Chitinophaga sp. NPDC101104 TaxID=3390561 RepID=UPI003D05E457
MMKLTAAILLTGFLHVSAGVYSQDRITLHMKSADLRKVLNAIEQKSGYRFLYHENLLSDMRRVDVSVENAEVLSVMERMLQYSPLAFELVNDRLIVLKKKPTAEAAAPVTGRVTGTDGLPIPGVAIRVKGSTTGAISDAQGMYAINAPEGSVLIFSFIGYNTKEVTVGGQSVINVSLDVAQAQLEQVVVIGYGTAQKRDLTGSIVSIKGSEVADKPSANPITSLQGRVAGLTIVNNGRMNTDPDIRIRGTNTINGVKPIFVVDGIINDNINFINPADIASMEILKDPSSLAIFGVRGANGVIIISTKKAAAGQTAINFNSTVGIKKVTDRIKLTDAAQFKMLFDEQLTNQGNPAYDYTNWQANTNWQDQIFQDGVLNYNNLSISNATDKNKFYAGMGYTTEQGLIKHEKLQKITINLNNELQVSKALKFGVNFSGYRALLPVTKDVGGAINAAPIAPVYNEEYGLYHTLPSFQRAQVFNPMYDVELRKGIARNLEYRAVGSVFGELKLMRDLTFRASFFVDYGFNVNRSYTPLITFYNPEINPPRDSVTKLTSVSQEQNIYTKVQSDYLLTYKRSFGHHNITALGGFTTYYNSYEKTSSTVQQQKGRPIPNDHRFWYANGNIGDATTLRGDGRAWDMATLSYLVRGLYGYKNKYLLNASYRLDGSNAFQAIGNQWQRFAAAGVAWVASEEDYLKDVSWLQYLKFKGSYGVLGNQNVGDRRYPAYPSLTGANSGIFGNNIVVALQPEYFVDPDLHWETARSWEAGFELTTLGNRLRAEVNYYNKLTKDILVIIPATGLSGGVGEMKNAGTVSNKGFELMLNWADKVGEHWSYNISGNLTTIKNKVEALNRKGFNIIDGPSWTQEGYPIGYFHGYIHDGIYQTQEEIMKSPVNELGEVKPGDIKYRDVNGDGKINADDRTIIGNPTPDFTYGITATVSYKQLDFGIEGQGVYGNEIFRSWGNISTFAQMNYPLYRMDRWHGVGTSNWEPILHTGRGNNTHNSTYNIEDGSYFRIRNVQLGYTFSRKQLDRIGLQSLRLFANAQNVKTFKRNSGYTPEFAGGSTSFGVDNGSYPLPAIYSFGVNVNF